MTDQLNYHRVAKQFHDVIVESDLDRMGVLIAFMQVWVSCNAQMDLEVIGEIDIKRFSKEAKRDLNQCRDLILDNIPKMLEEIKIFKQQQKH